MTHPYEPDRALADLDCLALRERVRELEERIKTALAVPDNEYSDFDVHGISYVQPRPVVAVLMDTRAALADHREGEDG